MVGQQLRFLGNLEGQGPRGLQCGSRDGWPGPLVRDSMMRRRKGHSTPVLGLICNQSPNWKRECPGFEVWEEGSGPGLGCGRSLPAFAGTGRQAWPGTSLVRQAVDLSAGLWGARASWEAVITAGRQSRQRRSVVREGGGLGQLTWRSSALQ